MRNGEGVEIEKLHTNIDRYPLGTMFIFLSLLIDELTVEEFNDLIISDSSHRITNTSLRESKLSTVKKFNIKNFEERVKELQEENETKKYSIDELGVFSWFNKQSKVVVIRSKKIKKEDKLLLGNSNNYKFTREENLVGEHIFTYSNKKSVLHLKNYLIEV